MSNPEQSSRSFGGSSDSLESSSSENNKDGDLSPTTYLEQSSDLFGHPSEGTVLMFETEVFIPSFHYDDTGLEILVSDGDWRYVKERQTLYYRHKDMEPGAVHTIRIKPRSMLAGGATSKVIEGSRSSRSVPGNKPESDPNCVSSCSIM